MDRYLVALQTEIGRLGKALAAREHQLQQMVADAQRLQKQGLEVEQQKRTALTWLLGLLIEHHHGEAVIMMPLLTELQCGDTVYGTQSELSEDGLRLSIRVVDGNGQVVEKPGHDLRAAAATAASRLAAAQATEAAEEAIERCASCGRKSPGHNLDCGNRDQGPGAREKGLAGADP